EPITLLADKEEERKNDSADTKAPEEKKNDPAPVQKPAKKNGRAKGLYLGIAGGPDLSNVKLQRIKNIGLNGGIVIGYQLSKRFSIESGAAWNRKYYYSEGQYFSTKNIYVPPGTKIENVKGDCNMIEWPLNVRYAIKNNGAVAWSGVAGVSSYFMMKENYDYLYLYPNGQTDTRNRAYKNTSNDWFSVINLAFAYSHQLGRSGSFRIEPYIKLPVKGVGIGSLPIISTGVNAGFIKKIF
ncbi:MAG TPA: outer membrane beta-barrel protein, partial [Chitinophaga sp.]|nr:outer membrane beta-barrel protein [Chitinophaga sp.]